MEGPEEYAGSVAWIKEGNYLAVGGSNGDVQVGLSSSAGLTNMFIAGI